VADTANSSLPRVLQTVFVDRDGVLNVKMPEGHYVTRWSEFHILPGAVAAIAHLNQARVRVLVVSNQRGIALGLYKGEDVEAIQFEFQKTLGTRGAHIDGFYFCPHDKGQCNCRKPLPGLFEQAVADFPSISAATSVMIGDSLSDIQFGRGLGMTTALIDGVADRQKHDTAEARALADLRFSSLDEAANCLLAGRDGDGSASGTMCLGLPTKPR
jgi:D-glycero-D-manno-heptose 1,7-bisphosphate phosphatase